MATLKEFLSQLALDASKLGEFIHDPEASMTAGELGDEDKGALRSGFPSIIFARLAGVPTDEAFNLTLRQPATLQQLMHPVTLQQLVSYPVVVSPVTVPQMPPVFQLPPQLPPQMPPVFQLPPQLPPQMPPAFQFSPQLTPTLQVPLQIPPLQLQMPPVFPFWGPK